MPEQLQKIIDRVVTWWKKFNNKQRALMLSLTAIVIVALVILYVVYFVCAQVRTLQAQRANRHYINNNSSYP